MAPTAPWADRAYARSMWPDAPRTDPVLDAMLAAAHGIVEEYAPALPDGAEAPPAYKLAEVLQARSLWAATTRDGDVIGFDDGGAVRVRPIDPTVKALLRPPAGRPVVG